MIDLSHLCPGLTPSSMAATNTISTSHAMTAPGTVSESTAGEHAGDPLTVPLDHQRTTIVHGGQS